MCWEYLPELLLEEILFYLDLPDRLFFAVVCKNWYDSFLSPNIWRHFPIHETTFVVNYGYNHYRKEYNKKVSPYRVQAWLSKVGHYVHCLEVLPNTNYYHVYEFMSDVASCLEYFETDMPLQELRSFQFTFACETRNDDEVIILGTGGKILEGLKRLVNLLCKLPLLQELVLNNLLLDVNDAPGLLDQVVRSSRDNMLRLEVLNVTKERYPLFYVGMFPSLQNLTISPLQLTDDVLDMVAGHREIQEVCIVQNAYCGDCDGIKAQTWENVKRKAPQLRVTLQLDNVVDKPLLIQENAPVKSVVLRCPQMALDSTMLHKIVDNYSSTLQTFAQHGLPSVPRSRSFDDRCDADVLYLVKHCTKLQTLIINEHLSAATLLKISEAASYLQKFAVRKDAILLCSDWPRSDTWDEEYHQWWNATCRSIQLTEAEVSSALNLKWRALTDSDFVKLK